MNKDLISVIIPTYNAADYILDSISSVLEQKKGQFNIEIIIVDDGSSDNTVSSIQQSIDAENITVLELGTNRGPAYARNEGIKVARGNFISLLDADDCYQENKLVKQFTFLLNHPQIDLVFSGLREFDEHGDYKKDVRFHLPDDTLPQAESIFLDKISGFTPTLFFRKGFFQKLGGFSTDLIHFEDQDFILRAVKEGTIAYMDELLTNRISRTKGMSKSVSEHTFLESRKKFESNAYELFPSLRRMQDQFWSIQYFGLGKLFLVRKKKSKARHYFYKSLKKKIGVKALVGLILSRMPIRIINTLLS